MYARRSHVESAIILIWKKVDDLYGLVLVQKILHNICAGNDAFRLIIVYYR